MNSTLHNQRSKIYFASDCHFGVPDEASSKQREALFISWLNMIKTDAAELYLVGDVFDFWFEYKTVVPKGYTRLLGKLAELSDAGILIHYFTGNHDMWVFDYFEKELGVKMYRTSVTKTIGDKKFFIAHGDGLGPGDHGYKFIKKVFANKICQFMFRWVHPDMGMTVGLYFSRKSRIANGDLDEQFHGDKEFLIAFINEKLKTEHSDYFIFGHRHLPLDLPMQNNSRYINLGEWIKSNTYAVFDGQELKLLTYSI